MVRTRNRLTFRNVTIIRNCYSTLCSEQQSCNGWFEFLTMEGHLVCMVEHINKIMSLWGAPSGSETIERRADRRRVPLQDEDHPGNDPHSIPSFPRLCSKMFPEWFWTASVSVGSGKIRLIQTEHPKCGTLSCWTPGTVFLVMLLSISSKICVVYSSLSPGTYVFRDWPFLGCSSCVSLVTAAKFRLFLNVAIFLNGKCYAVMKTALVFICFLY